MAKSIADRCDIGEILLDVTEEDKKMIEPLANALKTSMPNTKLSIYKNRRGQYVKCYLWMFADKGTCRYEGLFLTDYSYNHIDIRDIKINEER